MKFYHKFRTKIFLCFLAVILVSFVGFGMLSRYLSVNFMENHLIHSQTQMVHLTRTNIKMMFDDVDGISAYLMTNEAMQSLLSSKESVSSAEAEQRMRAYLSGLKNGKSYLSFVIIFGEDGSQYRYFHDFYREVVPYEQLKETPLYITTAAYGGAPFWNSSSATLFTFLDNYNDIMVSRRITNLYDKDQALGMLFVGIDRNAVRDLIRGINIDESTTIMLMDDNYNVVEYNLNNEELLSRIEDKVDLRKRILGVEETTVMSIEGKDYLVSVDEIEGYGWRLASLTPYEVIHDQTSVYFRYMVAGLVAALLFVALISAFLSERITLPIQRLLRSMSNFKRGDFNQYVEVHSRDEIGLLTKKYNEMAAELNQLIQKVYISQTNQKMIELKNLQSQIEPHFLYNTLDFIFLNSKINGDDQTARVVHSLSELFRISLNRGEDYYKLEYEIRQIKAYINIQQTRFPYLFDAVFDVEPGIEQFYTAKLLLQPIVENAIIHAFDHRAGRKGRLSITGCMADGGIAFTVEDDGKGMTEDQVRAILDGRAKGKGGYGVRNVNERLTMLFGDAYALNIESEPGRGTKVTIRLPIIKTEEEWKALYEIDGI